MFRSQYLMSIEHIYPKTREYIQQSDCDIIVGTTKLQCHSNILAQHSNAIFELLKTTNNNNQGYSKKFSALFEGHDVKAVELYLACNYQLEKFEKLVDKYGAVKYLDELEKIAVKLQAPRIGCEIQRYRQRDSLDGASTSSSGGGGGDAADGTGLSQEGNYDSRTIISMVVGACVVLGVLMSRPARPPL